MTNGKSDAKLISIKLWILVVSIIGILLTTATMGGMLVNDRYVVINKADLNTVNIAGLTLVVSKLVNEVELHTKSLGHSVMDTRMNAIEEGFREMKADIKEILRRTPR